MIYLIKGLGGFHMNYIDGSLNCVINGDWNRRYIQPDYIGQTVFGVQEMDIQISGLGSDSFGIIFHSGKIRVLPRQDRVQFIADDFEDETIARFEEVVIRFCKEIHTPNLVSFGYNCVYSSEDSLGFAQMVDELKGVDELSDLGASISDTVIKRHISFEGKEINTTERMNGDTVSIEFNEHHSGENIREEIQTEGSIKDFLARTEKIVKAMYPETGDD